jgi:hypothetical protein
LGWRNLGIGKRFFFKKKKAKNLYHTGSLARRRHGHQPKVTRFFVSFCSQKDAAPSVQHGI